MALRLTSMIKAAAVNSLTSDFSSVEIIELERKSLMPNEIRVKIEAASVNFPDLLRKGEAVYKEKNLSKDDLSDDEIITLMLENPILIERPIVFDNNLAIIGRPPENVMIFLK